MEATHLTVEEFMNIFKKAEAPDKAGCGLGMNEEVALSLLGRNIIESNIVKIPGKEAYEKVLGVGIIYGVNLSFRPEDGRKGIDMEYYHPVTVILATSIGRFKVKCKWNFSSAQEEEDFHYCPVVRVITPCPPDNALLASKRDGEEVVLRISAK